MKLRVNGHDTYCYTEGKAFNPAQPTVVFLHGVANDHSVWALQSRYFAHHGWNVLAPDLPGHCRSSGDAPTSVEAAAEFVHALLDAAGVLRTALVGHSWGSLIALEAASRLPQRVSHLALIGTAFPMPVSAALLETALNQPDKALQMVNVFSRSTLAPPPSSLGPGTWIYGAGLALGRKVLASNPSVNLLHRGFVACNGYAGGLEAMERLQCPVRFILGDSDQMTPPKAAKTLIDKAHAIDTVVSVVRLPVGHNQMTEAPDATLQALVEFLAHP